MRIKKVNRAVEAIKIKAVGPEGIDDKMNLRLVAGGVKPAALISVRRDRFLSGLGLKHAQISKGTTAISKDEGLVQELRLAHRRSGYEMHSSIGMALGYPRDAVEAWATTPRESDELRSVFGVHPLMVSMAQAVYKGVEVPDFMAYMNHEPASYDFALGMIPESSAKLANEYMEFMRTEYPGLAAKIERRFHEDLAREARMYRAIREYAEAMRG